jgi:hypothetical protein
MTDVQKHRRLESWAVKPAWSIYRDAMFPTKTDAAQRHMLTRDEFSAICYNQEIVKAVARDDHRETIGMAAYTRHLDAYDWIEPAYYAQRWPDAYKREAIFYVLFVVATDNAPPDTFTALVNTVVDDIRERRGVGALDWSQARVDRGLARASRLIIGRNQPIVNEHVDAQHFHTYEFDWDPQ